MRILQGVKSELLAKLLGGDNGGLILGLYERGSCAGVKYAPCQTSGFSGIIRPSIYTKERTMEEVILAIAVSLVMRAGALLLKSLIGGGDA